jgi:hypothetical protein
MSKAVRSVKKSLIFEALSERLSGLRKAIKQNRKNEANYLNLKWWNGVKIFQAYHGSKASVN